ncbi:MAG: family 20 glycosylhydrolase [Candidatus Omnitrophica bacterium]|nr:family 20 glycosylhydrolase [Candidatus Omnitrophota bacterium]
MKIKAVQLDLARQKENIDFIKNFINFIKKYGFNTLVFYLEGRIKTKTFPYMKDEESYKPEEMKEIVNYAEEKEIDIIPVVSNFDHTEQFLQFSQLKKISELREGIQGRFSSSYSGVCPSLEETYQFFEKYFSEIAEIFPSKYFHVGNDEVWDIGFCSLCKERIKKGETQADIFAKHIKKTYEIVKKLNKKMMMWDDMFELYPEALKKIPKDIIMCTWDYSYFVDLPHSHFTNFEKEDVFKKYEKIGFQYLFCPRELLIPNVYSFTEYAKRYKPLGGLITNWERSTKFQFNCFPVIAFSGKLWNCKDIRKFDVDKEFSFILENLIGQDKIILEAVKKYYFFPSVNYFFSENYIRGEISPLEEQYFRSMKLIYEILKEENTENKILDDIKIELKEQILKFELRKQLYENLFSNETKKIKSLLKELDKIKNEKMGKWDVYRKGIPCKIELYYNSIKEKILKFLKLKNKSNHFLFLYLFLPDIYGAPNLSFSICDKNKNWKKIFENLNLKPVFPEDAYYCFIFPFNYHNYINSVKIEVCGYGGQGITYLKIIDKNRNEYIPDSIKETQGIVENPTELLTENLRWTYLGTREIKIGFKWNEYREVNHSIEVNLVPS